MRKYFDDTLNVIRERYPNESSEKLAKELNIPITTIYGLANKMKVKKTQEFMNSEASGRLNKGSVIGYNSQFKKGSTPPNKGKKLTDEQKSKFSHTFFEKGSKPHNFKKQNHVSIRLDKRKKPYAWIKKSDNNWQLYHRWLFEKSVGLIPLNMLVAFKDGNTLNFDLSNLELITKQENINRNHIQNLTPEIKEITMLKRSITRKVNSILKPKN